MEQLSNPLKILFFGTTSDSVLVLSDLILAMKQLNNVTIVTVVTQPPRPIGRHHDITATPVNLWADKYQIACLSFPTDKDRPWLYENEQTVIDTINAIDYDLIVSACYGQKIPAAIINKAKYGGINIHPSLLPRFRGADPIPWTIMAGDAQSGVTLTTISEKFDQGKIIAYQKINLAGDENPDHLRTSLFDLGAKLLINQLPDYLFGKNPGQSQNIESGSYCRKITRDDGYVTWEIIQKALAGDKHITMDQWNSLTMVKSLNQQKILIDPNMSISQFIKRLYQALSPWPGVWTTIRIKDKDMRLKIHMLHLTENLLVLDQVQLEGKNPVEFTQFQKAYL